MVLSSHNGPKTLDFLLLSKCYIDGVLLSQIASETHGHVASDLVALCSEATLQQIREMDIFDLEGGMIDVKILSCMAVSQKNFRVSHCKQTCEVRCSVVVKC